ncbi:MAG: hypothetical protein ACOH2M_28275, partial [Cypionkella sp.]
EHIKQLELAGLVSVSAAFDRARGQFSSNRYVLGFEPDFQRQNLPTAKSTDGKNTYPPSAKSAVHRRQNLPNNPVSEPCKRTSKGPLALEPEKPAPEKRKRRCQLPEGWTPSERNISDAHSKQFSDREINHEADRFADFHRAKGSIFADWDAAWRTWLGNARKFSANSGTDATNRQIAFAARAGRTPSIDSF